jgi:6-phosphogluconolactonase
MTNSSVTEKHFDNVAEMARHLAADVARTASAAVEARGQALIALSGGRFSRHLFETLRGLILPWPHVILVLADERWVETDDALSNERLVREHLLDGTAAGARLLGLRTGGSDPQTELPDIESKLAALPFPFDLVLLGMGDDGHTASLFPSASIDELQWALSPGNGARAAVMHPSVSPVPRITLTLPTLLQAQRVVLHIPGSSKLATYRQAMRSGPITNMPVRGVLRQDALPVDVLICEREEP